jgi:Mg2+ and Co2+ transporter CorA
MFYLETRNMARMTYLAPIYVPLSYCSTIFGMEGNVRPGASGFWIYVFAFFLLLLTLAMVFIRP